ncbi:phosphatase PAP2 family protein [Paenibacillus aurantius]|uniref:Phosphatase PAP2 family protein n=1 Tax=Paenibacillus aurantius TaxID=2918900 RepID=A0AA96LHP1_9BACL|nr:phosphatase PAP2 family protein [Paenibacillus aurantius]WNQ14122.1 phosphatase PAP2 family protein [Paenibacillus aurantius]
MTKLYMTGLAAATAAVLYAITRVQNWGILCILVLLAALWGTRKDAKPISWIQFMPAGFITLLAFFVIYTYANPLWEKVVGWQTSSVHHIVNWNEWFNSIPLNDAAFLRVWQPYWLTKYMQWVYSYGFTLSYWICVIRAFFTKDVRKLGQYSLAGYLLQVPLILPFYNTILLQEVWHVQGTPDLLERGLTGDDVFFTVINCFPSMHTSIAFAAILLAYREKSRWYRWVIGVYGFSIITATMYLKIHWVLDVAAGMLFAYGCVKLSDWIVGSRFYAAFTERFEGLGRKLEAARPSRSRPEAGRETTKDIA